MTSPSSICEREVDALHCPSMASTPISFDHLLPEGVALHPFQTVGVAVTAVAKRTMIADEMGLGKTIQAITAFVAHRRLFPTARLTVVCPASLKGNWANEIRRFAPGLTVTVASGKTPSATTTDVVICNYDILGDWQASLPTDAVVMDESHYIKNEKALRTKAALALAARVPADGLVILLTGTPVLNRPVELLCQVEALGWLDGRLANGARGPRQAFRSRFCYDEASNTYTGARNLENLNDLLRQSGYVRRLRADVLGMHDTVRVPTVLSLNGALDKYRAAEADFLSFVRETKGWEAMSKAQRAETLTKINALRVLVGQAKVKASIEWVENFLDSNPDESLVIFAVSVEVQKALVAAFDCPAILGGQSTVVTEEAKRRFQAREARVIVCSLKAAREGHTLTAASNVLFVEQGWTPGEMQQAEDRINRISQTADYCYATILQAEDTIDQWMAALIESKRIVTKAAADGGEVGEQESMAKAIVTLFSERG